MGESKVLRVGLTNPPTMLDPRQASDATSHLVLGQVFECPYFQAGPETKPEPRVLASLLTREQKGNEVEYSAPVREGLVFSDGSACTADDVVASLADVPPIKAVARVSRRGDRVVFTTSRVIPNFEFQLSKRWCTIVRETPDGVRGTGPFMAGPDGLAGDVVRLEKNPSYRDPVPLDAIEFRVFPLDPDGRHTTLLDAIDAGEVDFTTALPRDEVGRLTGVRKLFQPGNSTGILYMNTERGPFVDVELRRALAQAVDRYELARVCYPDSPGLNARGLLPPKMGSTADGIRHNPSAAKQALEAAAGSLPAKLRTVTVWGPRPYVPKPKVVIDELNRQLASIGVELEAISTTSPEDYFEKLRDGEYECVLGGWIADSEDPADFLDAVLTTNFIPIPGRPTSLTANLSRWDDAQTNELVRDYRETPNPENIEAVLARVASEVVLLPLMYGPRVIVHTRNVDGFDPTPVYVPSLSTIDLS